MNDISKKLDSIEKLAKEAEILEKNLQGNPFSVFDRIAKDITDREDREMALAFTNAVCSLLKENGVFVKNSRYELETDNETDKNKYIIKKEYGVSFDGLDFTEHDKGFKDEIASLKRQIEKLESIRIRCHESARDSFDSGMYGCLHIVTADELKTTKDVNDRTVELPFDPLETANMLINATYKDEIQILERQVDRDLYNIDDLEQIAEHLMVYCRHHREDEE